MRSNFISVIIVTITAVMLFLIFSCKGSSVKQVDHKRPVIKKLGTIDCDMVETTPIVFRDKLYRYEYVRNIRYKSNTTGDSFFRFVDAGTGEPTLSFAAGYDLGSAFVEAGTVYVSCVNDWGGSELWLFRSDDLNVWQSEKIFENPQWKMYNTSMCRDKDGYVMAVELGAPPELVGQRFTMIFLRSSDLKNWQVVSEEYVYTKDRYSACPDLHFLEGFYYMIYLEQKDIPPGIAEEWNAYAPHIVRSSDLIHWENSPYNPIMSHSDEDKIIANPDLSEEQRAHIVSALNLNNSDVEVCEYKGKTIIYYTWGDQHGTEFLAEAYYEGSVKSFLKGFFPEEM